MIALKTAATPGSRIVTLGLRVRREGTMSSKTYTVDGQYGYVPLCVRPAFFGAAVAWGRGSLDAIIVVLQSHLKHPSSQRGTLRLSLSYPPALSTTRFECAFSAATCRVRPYG